DFSVSTEVISCASVAAVPEKLTMPILLPEPICPSCPLSVASSMMSINVLAPALRLARGGPAILPERSRTRTMSVGLEAISGAAAREMLRACLKMKNFIPPWGLLKNEQSDIFYIVQIFWEEEE